VLAACLTVSPALAQASPENVASRVRTVYEQDSTIPPCLFTSPELTTALNAVDAYGLEYFADYISAIQTALTLRAAGACSKNNAAGRAAVGRTPPTAALPASLTSPTRSGVPAPMLLLAIIGLVLAAAAILLTLGRRSESSATWAGRWRHGTAEASYRARDVWDTITDRVKR
jgi:hypothetical protein